MEVQKATNITKHYDKRGGCGNFCKCGNCDTAFSANLMAAFGGYGGAAVINGRKFGAGCGGDEQGCAAAMVAAKEVPRYPLLTPSPHN
jgi:hypothetical protein